MEKHTIGELAYIDSFLGLIPCKVIDIDYPKLPPFQGHLETTVKITANRRAYKREEVVKFSPLSVVPRKSVFVRSGQYRIRNNYVWSK